jgi:hypothetical protein
MGELATSTGEVAETGGSSESTGRPEEASEDDGGPTSDASTSGSASEGTDTGESQPEYPTPHFPLVVGLQWTYRLTQVDGEVGSGCDNRGDAHVMRVSDFDAGSGVYTVTEDPWCYFSALEYRIVDEYVDINSGDAWYHQLLLPPEIDATWLAGGASGASYVWDEHHATYTVEAGTFADCWRRKQQDYDVWQIYCHGVGMVVSHYAAWGGNSRAELIDFRE